MGRHSAVGHLVFLILLTVAAPAAAFSLDTLKKRDVLLNYAAIDDQPLFEGRLGWVSQLHRNLEVRIEQLSGEKVAIARLPESAVSPVVEGNCWSNCRRPRR